MTSPLSRESPREATASAQGSAAAPAAAMNLYHMSRTAGVGLQDYAAINVRAVIGLLLGLASALAFIFADSYLLMLVPLAAITVSLIGFIQISRSNGTQTGRIFAIAGLIVALGFASLTLGKQWKVHAAQSHAKTQMESMMGKFNAASLSGNGAEAYELFDSTFRESVALESFNRTLASRAKSISAVSLAPMVVYETGADGDIKQASSLMVVESSTKMENGAVRRIEVPVVFVRDGDSWKIHDIQNWFPATPKPGR